MSLGVSSGDLIGSWSLSFSDIAFVTGKAETARLGLAVQLRFFAGHGFFVPDHASIPSDGVLYLAEQLGLDAKSVNQDRKRVVSGQSVLVRVYLGGRGNIKKQKK